MIHSSLLVALSCLVAASSEVITLTDDNFETITQATAGTSKANWFVEFYAPWCGHCKALESTWERLATRVEDSNANVKVAKVDCTAEPIIAKRFEIRGFP